MSASSLPAATAALSGTFSGQLLQPHNPAYDEVRKLHNGLIDKAGADRALSKQRLASTEPVRVGEPVRPGGREPGGRCSVQQQLHPGVRCGDLQLHPAGFAILVVDERRTQHRLRVGCVQQRRRQLRPQDFLDGFGACRAQRSVSAATSALGVSSESHP